MLSVDEAGVAAMREDGVKVTSDDGDERRRRAARWPVEVG